MRKGRGRWDKKSDIERDIKWWHMDREIMTKGYQGKGERDRKGGE